MTAPALPHGCRYAVDLRVQISHAVVDRPAATHPATWTWMTVTVADKSVHVTTTDDDVREVAVLPVAKCVLTKADDHCYVLGRKGLCTIRVYCPSPTVWSNFTNAMATSHDAPSFSPAQDAWPALLDVAASIVDQNQAYQASPCSPCVVRQSSLSVAHVQVHLAEMKAMYDLQLACATDEDLYEKLLEIEAAYVEGGASNFAHTVHRLHPKRYKAYEERRDSARQSVKSALRSCPHGCNTDLRLNECYRIHMQVGTTISCRGCHRPFSLDTFKLVQLIRHFNSRPAVAKETTPFLLPLEFSDGTIPTYLDHVMRLLAEADSKVVKQVLSVVRAFLLDDVGSVGWIDFDLVLAMARQLDFVAKVCHNYTYWSHPLVLEASIVRYHNFMHLMKKGLFLVPTVDIDLAWHAHQCLPSEYRQFCLATTSKLIDHDDTVGGGALAHGYAGTFRLWSTTFHGEPYSSFRPAVDGSASKRSKKKAAPESAPSPLEWWVRSPQLQPNPSANLTRIPSYHSRFVGVDEPLPELPNEQRMTGETNAALVAVIGTPVMVDITVSNQRKHSSLARKAQRVQVTRAVKAALQRFGAMLADLVDKFAWPTTVAFPSTAPSAPPAPRLAATRYSTNPATSVYEPTPHTYDSTQYMYDSTLYDCSSTSCDTTTAGDTGGGTSGGCGGGCGGG